MAAPIDTQFPPWVLRLRAARHLLLVQFWSATSFLLTPFALLLVAAAPKVRQPLHHDGVPWPPTDSWAQMFSIPLAGLSILAFLGAWGLLRSAGVRSISTLWLLAGFCCCALGAWCFPGVGWLPPWMDDWAERRTPLFVALGLFGQGFIYQAWPGPVGRAARRPGKVFLEAGSLTLAYWLLACAILAMAYWLRVEPVVERAIFPYRQVVLLCLVAALVDGWGLLWRFRHLRGMVSEHLMISPPVADPSAGAIPASLPPI